MISSSQMQSTTIPAATEFAGQVRSYFEELQRTICSGLESVDGSAGFRTDPWNRREGGGGITRVLENGGVFEKAGVNTSTVFGRMSETLARKMNVPPTDFFATGISIVLHPKSPMVPTVHANLRYFEQAGSDAWFGGGTDLTPYYLYEEDVVHFHKMLKRACDQHDPEFYPKFKKWCDEYFFIKHRGETRGVGGVFFDYLRGDREKYFAFVQSVGDGFLEAYTPIVSRRMNDQWGEHERSWQLHRRGRYAEFNLVYDRGTTFGLETNGRAESILMSLPPLAQWKYDMKPEPGSREERLVSILTHPREWV